MTGMSRANPYEPPKILSADTGSPDQPGDLNRRSARRAIRFGMLVLLAPGLVNFTLYHFTGQMASMPFAWRIQIFAGNFLGTVAFSLGVWFVGLQVLEFATGGLFTVFSKRSKLSSWLEALYETLTTTPRFAFCGAILWAVWLIGIHAFHIPFIVISIPVGIAAHLLAAAFYVPLMLQFNRIEKEVQ